MSEPSKEPRAHGKDTEIRESLRQVQELVESARRQTEAVDAWIVAIPEGLTANDLRDAARRFVDLAEQAGPRRGLCRFGVGPSAGAMADA